MKLNKDQIKTLADAIANSNAHRHSFIGTVYDANGVKVGYVHFMGGITVSHKNAVGLVSDWANGADLLQHFIDMLGCDMPEKGSVKVVKRRKKLSNENQ